MPTQRVGFFDLLRPGYGGAVVNIYLAGTTTDADVFTDEALTAAAANPQTLTTFVEDGITYGRWTAPLYTSQAVELLIDNADDTGIIRPPLLTLAGENASDALVTTTAGTEARALDNRFDDVIHALDYGELAASAATNNATLTAAIGVAAAQTGGIVLIPDGTYEFTSLTLSEGVVLQGEGRDVTILQCQTGGNCITLGGDSAGLRNLTFDGVNKIASSVGVFSKANNETVFDDVDIKRFVTGMHFKGGQRAQWRDLYITNNTTGAKLHGDIDSGGGADGDEYRHNDWTGGLVSLNVAGVDLSFEDRKCYHNTFRDVGFESNTGAALTVNGARFSNFYSVWFASNTTTLVIQDDGDLNNALINTIIGCHFYGGSMDGGAVTLVNTLQDVIFDGMEISDVDFTLTTPINNVLFRDAIEDSLVTISGTTTRFGRIRTNDRTQSVGVTTDATPTKAWSIKLNPGEFVYLESKVLGNQRNDEAQGGYHQGVHAHRPGSDLDYDAQVSNFSLGDLVTGATSGATGRIVADSDAGATGTLTLKDIVGVFQDDEQITDPSGGDAIANGTLTTFDAALRGAVVDIKTMYEDVAGWDADFVVNGAEIEVQVTGAASDTIDWVVDVDVTVG